MEKKSPFWPQSGPLFFLAAIFFSNFMARIILAPLLPTIERDLGVGHGQAGMFFLLISMGYIVAMLGSGFLSSRITHRGTIFLSCALVGIALLGISLTQSLWAIRLGLLGLGLAAGLYIPSAIATITSLVGATHWGMAMAIHELAPNLAFIAAPLLAELLLGWFSWRSVLALLGAAAVVESLAFARFGSGGNFRGENPAFGSFRTLLSNPSFRIVLILFGLGISATLGVFSMLPLYLVAERGMDQDRANLLIGLSRLSCPGMAFLAGWASDRLGPTKTLAAILLLTGLTTVLLGPLPGSWIVIAVFLQPALAVSFFPPGFAALSAIGSTTGRNVAVSLAVPLGFLMGAGGIPMFIGVMGEAGSFASGFALVGSLILSGALLSRYLKLPRQAP